MKNRKGTRNFIFFLVILIGIIGAIQSSYGFNLEKNNSNEIKEEVESDIKQNLKIHVLDVGQGDSIFLELPDSQTMLIDAAEKSEEKNIVNFIKEKGYTKIDYVIATHPHADHIGGLSTIINTFEIGNIYMPKASSNSKTYENLLQTIVKKNLKVKTAKNGVVILENNNLKIEFIAPNSATYQETNNYSAVIKITYGNQHFLFMGDAEIESENEITAEVASDLIKVGHHGSNTSSGIDFVKKVKPKYAIISVGKKNTYNHPNEEIINRWKSIGAEILRTDQDGTIQIESNGNELKIISELEKRKEN